MCLWRPFRRPALHGGESDINATARHRLPTALPEVLLEAVAVAASLAFTLLYLRGAIPLAWVPALFGSLLFTLLCWRRQIYAESALHLFYVAMALYGFFTTAPDWQVVHWSLALQLPWLLSGAVLSLIVGGALRHYTNAHLPWLDAFTTVFSVIATWLMAHYVHEAWLYWIVIDTAAIALYAARKLYLGAGLFVVYLLMAIDGYFTQLNWFG